MAVTRRKFLATGLAIVSTSSAAFAGIPELNLLGKYTNKSIQFKENDWNDLPFHGTPYQCSGYPYELPELDDNIAVSDSYLHDPEIENKW